MAGTSKSPHQEPREGSPLPGLDSASDAEIDDAVAHADPMVLRGLLFQLTGDPELEAVPLRRILGGYLERLVPATAADAAMLRGKAAAFLRRRRDAGCGPADIGPRERLPASLGLLRGEPLAEGAAALAIEELALDPGARSLRWREPPDPARLDAWRVVVIGAGMGGLAAALALGRAGLRYTVIEKNAGVGGTWHENRYPGARLDSPSRSYTHTVGVDYPYDSPFNPWADNQRYFDWLADSIGLRDRIVFGTEVTSMTWDEDRAEWELRLSGPDGERLMRANAVLTAVGFLNRPRIPALPGAESFAGGSWHTSRWPAEADLSGRRVAVIGTGCSGYQLIPEVALEAAHVAVFQRTPQWVFPVPGYRRPFKPQVAWLNRNMPFYTNFSRIGGGTSTAFADVVRIDPAFDDPHACSAGNRRARDVGIAFLEEKLPDPALREAMTPPHPVWSARPVAVDPEYSILDALQRDNVTLVTAPIERVDPDGIVTADGGRHEVDAIVYATGFHATEYLFPMSITGRDGRTVEAAWAAGGARAYRGCMVPGFPNLWTIYGPNTNGALPPASFHEMVAHFALQCIEAMILGDKRSVEVRSEPFEAYNTRIDALNRGCVWSDPRARSYYWTRHGRSATQNPLSGDEMWALLHRPDFDDLVLR